MAGSRLGCRLGFRRALGKRAHFVSRWFALQRQADLLLLYCLGADFSLFFLITSPYFLCRWTERYLTCEVVWVLADEIIRHSWSKDFTFPSDRMRKVKKNIVVAESSADMRVLLYLGCPKVVHLIYVPMNELFFFCVIEINLEPFTTAHCCQLFIRYYYLRNSYAKLKEPSCVCVWGPYICLRAEAYFS